MEYDKLEFETTFKNGDMIPIEYTGYGKNISPEFRIKNLSDRAKKSSDNFRRFKSSNKKLYSLDCLEYKSKFCNSRECW